MGTKPSLEEAHYSTIMCGQNKYALYIIFTFFFACDPPGLII